MIVEHQIVSVSSSAPGRRAPDRQCQVVEHQIVSARSSSTRSSVPGRRAPDRQCQVVEHLIEAGRFPDGDRDILIVVDASQDVPRLAFLLADLLQRATICSLNTLKPWPLKTPKPGH
ncbi:hypothetical protein [Nonomuraea typhae]|uniref:hypothetical protein n=1 Tax=Nonomuraea typhae TaxID=2603600 RepID=UPI0012FB99E5|nr:hypothetical protein [Nonomuraea typhae]